MWAMSSGRPIVLGRYELHAPIARGGMATVYFGRVRGAVGFARTVAIKRLHPQLASDSAFRAMFIDEARLVARIRHPNVVQVVDVVTEGEELFLVMDYVHGESLDGLIHRPEPAPIPPAIATAIFADVLHGLHAAHEATTAEGTPLGIIHRDVTPHNVMVGIDGAARIADFGIAKASARQQWTNEGQIKGKLAYLAPEQFEGSDAARSADVYAAAASLHEALTGRILFGGDNEANIMTKIMLGATKPPSALAPSIPPALDEVVMRGLEMKPRDRFQTAREMALALESCMDRPHASTIAAWVETRAAGAIAKRAASLATIERTPLLDSVPPPGGLPEGDGNVAPRRLGENDATRVSRADGLDATAMLAASGATRMGLGTFLQPKTLPMGDAPPRFATDAGALAGAPRVGAGSVGPPPREASASRPDAFQAHGSNGGAAVIAAFGAPLHRPRVEDPTPVATTLGGHPSRRSRALVVAVALLLVASSVVAGVWRLRHLRGRASAAVSSPAPSATDSSSAAPDLRTPVGAVDPRLAAAGAPSAPPSPGAAGSAVPPPPHLPGKAGKPPGGATKPPPVESASADECNPPYIRDANGEKQYKRRCL